MSSESSMASGICLAAVVLVVATQFLWQKLTHRFSKWYHAPIPHGSRGWICNNGVDLFNNLRMVREYMDSGDDLETTFLFTATRFPLDVTAYFWNSCQRLAGSLCFARFPRKRKVLFITLKYLFIVYSIDSELFCAFVGWCLPRLPVIVIVLFSLKWICFLERSKQHAFLVRFVRRWIPSIECLTWPHECRIRCGCIHWLHYFWT